MPDANQKIAAITASGKTIYDPLDQTPDLKLSTQELQQILRMKLSGMLLDQPIRTRSKVVKSAIARSLGYPVPRSFLKSKPRFPGQDFDVYVQKSDNLQIWNEELAPRRRYVLVRVNDANKVQTVKVVNGVQLAKLDTTGTLTSKYQATAIADVEDSRLVSAMDTPELAAVLADPKTDFDRQLIPIVKVYEKLLPLMGQTIPNPGNDQERVRGWELHKLISDSLGIETPNDDGQIPDISDQLLEIKLQTSPTVDLGLISPGSADAISVQGQTIRYADIRYAVVYGTVAGDKVRLDHLVLTNGADFFCYFKSLRGNVVNKKNQIRLPRGFFDELSPTP